MATLSTEYAKFLMNTTHYCKPLQDAIGRHFSTAFKLDWKLDGIEKIGLVSKLDSIVKWDWIAFKIGLENLIRFKI